jgi:hypothetical protein
MIDTNVENAPWSCMESSVRQFVQSSHWKHWIAFNKNILGHSYCERTWVAQEIVFSKRAFILFGGAKVSPFTWNTFEMALVLAPWVPVVLKDPLTELGVWNRDVEYELHAPPRATINFGAIGRYRRDEQTWLDFLGLLVSLRSLKATDPRDKIYGLQYLARNRSAYSAPDYSKTNEEVYTKFAEDTLVCKSEELSNLLAEAGLHKQDRKGLSSWAPDWTLNQDDCVLNFHSTGYIEEGTLQLYNFSDKTQLQWVLTMEGAILKVKGQILDPVKYISSPSPSDWAWQICPQAIHNWNMECNNLIRLAFSEQVPLESNETIRGGVLSRYAEILSCHLFTRRLDRTKPFDLLATYHHVMGTDVNLDDLDSDQQRNYLLYRTAFEWTKRGSRTLAIAGSRMLIAPQNVQQGDCVALLDGYLCGAVLRPNGSGTWQYVGDAFIEGDLGCRHLQGDPEDILLS